MTHYRLYLLIAASGRIHSAIDVDAPDDAHAIQIADGLLEDKSIEVWCGGRKVHRLEAPSPRILARHRAHQAKAEFQGLERVLATHFHGAA